MFTFFEDLNSYVDSGLFGLDTFGKYLIVYLILFLTVGIMSYKYGLSSSMSLSVLVFGVIYFFDVVIGLIPEIRGVEHLLTYLSALIIVVSIVMEVQR